MAPSNNGPLVGANTTALWLDRLSPITRRPRLTGNTEMDVAIVGGGFSGLWTAYYLAKMDPSIRVMVIEKDFCGFGASGRNGGWAVGELANSVSGYAKRSSQDEAVRQLRAVFDSVDEIGRVTSTEGIDCGYAKGGWIRLARSAPQADRQREEIAHERQLGFTEQDIRLLEPDEARKYLNGSDVRGGIWFAHCASVDPARLVRGLAETVEALGVQIVEDTPATAITDGRVETPHGVVAAEMIVRATEAYTRNLAGERRSVVPFYSRMIATEPLSDELMADIGLSDRPTFSDDRMMVIYGQRTEDNRLAFGGRGIPYSWGSKIDPAMETHLASHKQTHAALLDVLPMLRDTEITHRWGGVLGVTRNWTPGLHIDRAAGQATMGGYVGEGVAATNLAGQTMADLVTGQNTDRTSMPWVGVTSRRWEPEPFRWLGINGSRRALAIADDREALTDKPGRLAQAAAAALRGS